VSLINTLLSMRVDLNTKKPVLANMTGGLSGPAVFPVALRMVWQVYEAVSIPVIGLGGIASAENVIEMMLAGATAVQIGAMNLVQPTVCRDIIEQLPAVMDRYGIENLSEITGGAHR
jgi:dihydroorotate dehydrogenase (NAD+) catalytic subunit